MEQGSTGIDGMTASVEAIDAAAWRVVVSGELDAASSPRLAALLEPLVDADAPSIVVNLADVTFMDSSGLRELVRAANLAKAQGGSLVLARASTAVTRLLEVTGLVEHLRPETPSG